MPQNPLSLTKASSFAAFADLDLTFSPGLNVVVGDNGTGKSQLLKLLYCACAVLHDQAENQPVTRSALNRELAQKLIGVFQPESLGRLTNRVRGRSRAEVSVGWQDVDALLNFSFATNSRSEVTTNSAPAHPLPDTPVYLPTRELMSVFPGFVSLYNERAIAFDETWRDTADLLGRPALRGRREKEAQSILEPIEKRLGGRVIEKNNKFYLHQDRIGNLEMHLVAEGLRKLAMIVRLVQSGTLLQGGYLFWDEPEASLNPQTLGAVADVILRLANTGVQVFVATHSMYLLRELQLQSADQGAPSKVIGLARGEEGVFAKEASSVDDLDLMFIASLSAEIDQADRYLRA